MRQTVLPWESVPGDHYSAIDTRQKGWVRVGGWLLVAALLLGGAITRWRIALVFALLYALALLMEKYVAVTERGLEIFHQMQFTTNYERWDWKDIYAVTHETDPGGSGRIILYFTKGDRTKRNYYAKEDAQEILKLAQKQNPDIKIFSGEGARDQAKSFQAKKKKK